MLPVTHHKVLVVPHSLAAVAAAVCLVAALAWDRQAALENDLAGIETAIESQSVAEEEASEKNNTARAGEQRRDAATRRQLEIRLFPILLNPSSGGG